jgi:hypothetical protein
MVSGIHSFGMGKPLSGRTTYGIASFTNTIRFGMQSIFSVIVALFASIALLLAWLSRREIAARAVFGSVGIGLLVLSIAGFIFEADWLWWLLLLVSGLGMVVFVWAGIVLAAITRKYGNKAVRRMDQ